MKRQIYSLLQLSYFGVSPICLAERVGFEPTNRLLGLHLSRVLHYRSAIFPYVLKATRADNPFRVHRLLALWLTIFFTYASLVEAVFPYVYPHWFLALLTEKFYYASPHNIFGISKDLKLAPILFRYSFIALNTMRTIYGLFHNRKIIYFKLITQVFLQLNLKFLRRKSKGRTKPRLYALRLVPLK